MSSFSATLPFFNDAVAGTVVQVAPRATLLHALKLVNTSSAAAYLQIFTSVGAASVVLGTTVPDAQIRLSGNESLMIHLPLPLQPSAAVALSMAGTSTPGGSTGAAISVTAFYE